MMVRKCLNWTQVSADLADLVVDLVVDLANLTDLAIEALRA